MEVFPPLFPIVGTIADVQLQNRLDDLVEDVTKIKDCADLILVANVKNPELLKVSTLRVAALIQAKSGIQAAPSIVARDLSRLQLLSEIVTAYSLGLTSVMLVWGDRYPAEARSRNVYDFQGLAEVIGEASRIGKRTGVDPRILTPFTLAPQGGRQAKLGMRRAEAGASLFLGQPPTTDPHQTFDEHEAAIGSAGLEGRVLLNAFPFRDTKDVLECEKYFGWTLPERLHGIAKGGSAALIREARSVVSRLRLDGYPGVYVSTRGEPSIARDILS
ncbi:MAG: hypothetical protein ACHQYR_03965 [Candidatus Gagatemarchaeaceae archaeon]